MSATGDAALTAHLASGATTVARAWVIRRTDGVTLGFTDHDLPLAFEGVEFSPRSGFTAMALEQTTGLSVDNTEALGLLSHDSVTEADIDAGRYDGAEVTVWLVNWQDVQARSCIFRGTIGEIRRAGGGFRAEVRGLAEHLNRPVGRVFQKPCTAVLGDAACGFDLATPGYSHEGVPLAIEEGGRVFRFPELPGFDAGWFAGGRLAVLEGPAAGLGGVIKHDRNDGGSRLVALWAPLPAAVDAGVRLRIEAGCDKRFETCRLKFANALNFQGFPDLPEEEWVLVPPARSGSRGGGSRR